MAASEARLPADQRIDFVSIVTPNNAPRRSVQDIPRSGFHVVCDKPLALTLEEAEEVVCVVERTGLVFALTHNYTATPMVREARHLFQSGKMGTVRKVIVEYLQDWLVEPQEKRGRSRQPGGRIRKSRDRGAMGDIGTHALNLVEYVTGDRVTEILRG